mmetsp:Transcript_67766/g.122138  ORF Transcript_67766/g.122138 Transcript_67766/m.122138 type:complete len:94 (+) Transcript_67766:1157-1438(+)
MHRHSPEHQEQSQIQQFLPDPPLRQVLMLLKVATQLLPRAHTRLEEGLMKKVWRHPWWLDTKGMSENALGRATCARSRHATPKGKRQLHTAGL